jgi:hypothetical protein
MPYVPSDINVYTAAYTGALAGMTGSMATPSGIPTIAKYSGLAAVAGPFAEEFDTQWAAYVPFTPLNELDLEIISSLSESAWEQKAPLSNYKSTPALYTELVSTLIAVCKAGENYYGLNGIVPPPVPGGGGSTFLDSAFEIDNAGDLTKKLKTDLSGQGAGTTTTISTQATISRPFRLPNQSGTAVVQQDTTGLVLLGQLIQDQGSNAGVQMASLTGNRGAFRGSQYGANTGAPGVVGFKSRGLTIGAKLSVAVGDILWRATAIGVTGNDTDIPLAGTIGFEIPAGGVFTSSLSPDFLVALAKDSANSRRNTWRFVGLNGDLNMELEGSRLRLKEGANAMQGVATLGVGGTITVANTLITANSRIMISIQDGAVPLGITYLASRIVGTSFTLSSTNAADTVTVAWQIWEPAA